MYKVFFNQPADMSTIIHLGKQFAPGQPKFVQDAYKKAISIKYRPLVLDFSQSASELLRVRSSLFPNDCEIYLPE